MNKIISIINNKNIIVNIIIIIDPIDEILFHKIKKSEKIMYRRGIPFKPIKCCGKNVIFVEIIILKKLIIIQLLLIFELFINGIQNNIIVKIEKITPIDKM